MSDGYFFAQSYVNYIKEVQEYIGGEAHALRFARALEIRVRIGRENRCHVEHPNGPLIITQPWYFGNSDVLRHETAHVLMWWSGLEAAVIEEHGEELGWQVVENLCVFATAFLKMPPAMYREAVKLYGQTAEAVRHLQRAARSTPQQALYRMVYNDPNAEIAGFLTSGKYIAEVAQCNCSLPFGWLECVPNPMRCFGDDARISMAVVTRSQLIGIAVG